MEILPSVITEMFQFGEVNESFLTAMIPPLDLADNLTRYKALYHPAVIAKRLAEIQICMDARKWKAQKAYEDSNDIIEMNKDCETKIIDMVSQIEDNEGLNRVEILLRDTLVIF